jgi:glutathione synthase/RimK-type ligase-like ATP-grasp enzyme
MRGLTGRVPTGLIAAGFRDPPGQLQHMSTIVSLRASRPAFYPDQALYAEFAARHFGLGFELHDDTGLVFSVTSKTRRFHFGGGKCPACPQNDATSAYLATDKYFASVILSAASIPNTGGNYFFLNDRFSRLRSPGHDVADAARYFQTLGSAAFVKPLTGSRGDFAQTVSSEGELKAYIAEVSRYHDSILMQRVWAGREYRIFVLDGEILYCARKHDPVISADGKRTIRDLIADHIRTLERSGTSSTSFLPPPEHDLDRIPAAGESVVLPGRRNRNAGGVMTFENPRNRHTAFRLAAQAASALNLRVAGVDIFEDDSADEAERIRIVEVNSNPAIRLLEDSGRDDLVLRIWRSTFVAVGLLDAATPV